MTKKTIIAYILKDFKLSFFQKVRLNGEKTDMFYLMGFKKYDQIVDEGGRRMVSRKVKITMEDMD